MSYKAASRINVENVQTQKHISRMQSQIYGQILLTFCTSKNQNNTLYLYEPACQARELYNCSIY